ncbi:MAG: zinc ribbon domain-containing protein, partial [Oscillospiraceae bacterium]|nr:zinc ribbon domain-containing protein [Oscillospiraceae bacterium]
MQYCRICSNELEDTATICPLCGAPVQSQLNIKTRFSGLFAEDAQTPPTASLPKTQAPVTEALPAQPAEEAPAPAAQPLPVAEEAAAPTEQPLPQTPPQLPAQAPTAAADDELELLFAQAAATVQAAHSAAAEQAAEQTEKAADADISAEAVTDAEEAAQETAPAQEAPAAPDKKAEKESKKLQKQLEKEAKRAAKRAEKEAALLQKKKDTEQASSDALLRGTGLGKGSRLLGLLLALTAVVAAVGMVVLPLLQQREAQQQSETDLYLSHLCGSWLSEPFVYAEDDALTPPRELLVLNEDYTFSSTNYASPSDRDSFDAATWTPCDATEGTWVLETET